MARIPYEYDNDTPLRSREPGAKMRLVLIFMVILAVTAAVIWMIVPHGKAGTAAAGDPVAEQKTGETLLPEPPPAVPVGVDNRDAETGGSNPPAGETTPPETAPAESAGGDDAGMEKNENSEIPAAAGTTPADAPPVKGVPWAGDPPEKTVSAPDSAEQLERERSRAGQLLFDSGSGAGAVVHQVKGGESLSRISRRYHTTIEGILYTNKLKSSNIRIGQKLRIIPGPWRIEVSKSRKILRLYRKIAGGGEELFYLFDIGIGRLNRTPSAEFVVFDRIWHPKWYAPDGAIYPYGDPGNPLGDYFLKLAPAGKPERPLTGYGIHGTADDSAVGRSLSNGCIRMHNRDVERLWMAVPVGTAVSVKD